MPRHPANNSHPYDQPFMLVCLVCICVLYICMSIHDSCHAPVSTHASLRAALHLWASFPVKSGFSSFTYPPVLEPVRPKSLVLFFISFFFSASRLSSCVLLYMCVRVLLRLYVSNAHMSAFGRVCVCVRRCVCVVRVAWATNHTECVLPHDQLCEKY